MNNKPRNHELGEAATRIGANRLHIVERGEQSLIYNEYVIQSYQQVRPQPVYLAAAPKEVPLAPAGDEHIINFPAQAKPAESVSTAPQGANDIDQVAVRAHIEELRREAA